MKGLIRTIIIATPLYVMAGCELYWTFPALFHKHDCYMQAEDGSTVPCNFYDQDLYPESLDSLENPTTGSTYSKPDLIS